MTKFREYKTYPASMFQQVTLYSGTATTNTTGKITTVSLLNPLIEMAYIQQKIDPTSEALQQLDGVANVNLVSHILYFRKFDINYGLPDGAQPRRTIIYIDGFNIQHIYKVLTSTNQNPVYPVYTIVECKWQGSLPMGTIASEAVLRF